VVVVAGLVGTGVGKAAFKSTGTDLGGWLVESGAQCREDILGEVPTPVIGRLEGDVNHVVSAGEVSAVLPVLDCLVGNAFSQGDEDHVEGDGEGAQGEWVAAFTQDESVSIHDIGDSAPGWESSIKHRKQGHCRLEHPFYFTMGKLFWQVAIYRWFGSPWTNSECRYFFIVNRIQVKSFPRKPDPANCKLPIRDEVCPDFAFII